MQRIWSSVLGKTLCSRVNARFIFYSAFWWYLLLGKLGCNPAFLGSWIWLMIINTWITGQTWRSGVWERWVKSCNNKHIGCPPRQNPLLHYYARPCGAQSPYLYRTWTGLSVVFVFFNGFYIYICMESVFMYLYIYNPVRHVYWDTKCHCSLQFV